METYDHFAASSIAGELDERGLAVTPNFIEPDLVRDLRAETLALRAGGDFRPAGVGRGEAWHLNPEIRSDFVHWIDPAALTPLQKVVWTQFEDLRLAINARLLLGLFSWEGHLTIYPPGARYARHLDRFRSAMHRTVSTILYLNEGWTPEDGGQLRIYLDTGSDPESFDVLPEAGTLVTFLSDRFEHEVLPAARERMSLTGWFTRRA